MKLGKSTGMLMMMFLYFNLTLGSSCMNMLSFCGHANAEYMKLARDQDRGGEGAGCL